MTTPANSLRQLAEGKDAPVTKMTIFRVKPSLVQFEEGFNLRNEKSPEVKEHIEQLYLAMKEGAFIPPIDVSVETGTIICRDGYCRTMAGQRLEEEMPEFTMEARQLRGNEVDAVIHMLGTGSGGLHLTPLEQGKGYLRLVKMGLPIPQIAAKLGVSRVTIDKGLLLAEAPVRVQKMVQSGKVSSTTAIDALKQGTEGVAALEKAVNEHEVAKPTTKKGKKKKVTNKTLRGTAADKKAKKKVAENISEDFVTVTLCREAAKEALSFFEMLLDPDKDPLVNDVRNAIDAALI